ncbi:hypothetical protein PYCCODRAFT_1363805 [Trametes coccinea BRFM310]|uniref:Uncharacterized protein n=1 Tax=Trametes coccinea (strain BRFM310) TaxID=1353009 RepID=A0A1Y2IV68_TRAC3|nr:hypothetical protein PYCCODRAFT_1363805 [Trametes coccinea BRFM310]
MALCENSIEIDDTDESIRYSGPWQSFSDQSYGFNGTRHVATAPGLSANFKFNGTCVIVTGMIGSNGSLPMPPTTFILDGHFTQMNTSATAPGTPFPGAPEFSQSLFYIALTVLEGEHELIITNLGANASVPLMLDGFIITPPGGDDGGRGVGAANASSTSTSTSTLSSSSLFSAPIYAEPQLMSFVTVSAQLEPRLRLPPRLARQPPLPQAAHPPPTRPPSSAAQ